VYIIEYAGPILIHLSPLVVRPYVYSGVSALDSLSPIQKLAMAMLVAHFVKRELETLFIHKFSSSTMPLFNLFKNSGHYWFLAGLNIAYWVFSPTAIAAKPIPDQFSAACVYVGIAFYVFGEITNLYTHLVLSSLRSRGGTERGIPRGFGFNWVTCPNYLFEVCRRNILDQGRDTHY
jgi:very-long-chain enoyl-CoA reductase